MNARLAAVRARLAEQALDGLLVTQPENRRYLSGFTGSSGVLLVTPLRAMLATDGRYYQQVRREAPSVELVRQDPRQPESIAGMLVELGLRRVGFEAEALTVADYSRWQAAAPETVEWIATEGIVAALREVKDDQELELIRRAQAISDAGFERLLTIIQPGKTEAEVAWEFEFALRQLGADDLAFSLIVACGPNAALPHYHPGDRVIGKDEIVLVDFGVLFQGYRSDCTRTFFTGDPAADPEYVRVYTLCLQALEAAKAGIRSGISARAADALARDLIAAAGYGDEFSHGLGHGIGLAIHERPTLSYRVPDDVTLAAGSVITIEPGIYRPGWGGVRIEDLVVVREDGVEVLTQASKDIDAWRAANRR